MGFSKKNWREFVQLIKSSSDEGVLETVLDVFLTLAEQEDLTKRYQIVRSLLSENKPQRTIAKELGLSISKITRGANELKRTSVKTITFLTEKMNTDTFRQK